MATNLAALSLYLFGFWLRQRMNTNPFWLAVLSLLLVSAVENDHKPRLACCLVPLSVRILLVCSSENSHRPLLALSPFLLCPSFWILLVCPIENDHRPSREWTMAPSGLTLHCLASGFIREWPHTPSGSVPFRHCPLWHCRPVRQVTASDSGLFIQRLVGDPQPVALAKNELQTVGWCLNLESNVAPASTNCLQPTTNRCCNEISVPWQFCWCC